MSILQNYFFKLFVVWFFLLCSLDNQLAENMLTLGGPGPNKYIMLDNLLVRDRMTCRSESGTKS